MTPEQKQEIYDIGIAHYTELGANVETGNIDARADIFLQGLVPLYQKLTEKNLVPEGMTLDIFHQIVLPQLKVAFHNYQVHSFFTGLNR